MAINKVVYGEDTLIDLTLDTVTPQTLATGVTAHDRSGAVINGSYTGIPAGGSTGQVLTKSSNSDYEVDWETTNVAATQTPKPIGTAAVGTSSRYAREDHVHPVQDSGWQYTNFSSPFANYSSSTGNRPKYRRINGIVEVWGVATVSTNTSTSNDLQVMFTLPSGYRPSGTLSIVSQGSGKNSWLFTIYPNGNASLSRYGTTSNGTISPGNWLPFHAIFIAA